MPVQLVGFTYHQPTTITKRTTPTLVATRTAFVAALSRMPITNTQVVSAMITTAGRLNQPEGSENGVVESLSGMCHRNSTSSQTLKYLVQSAASTPQLMAYSRTRSQPMIQASNSPSVA